MLYNPASKIAKRNPISIITKFSNQHAAIKQIVKRYWYILTMDPVIGPYITKDRSFTFKRARSLRDHLVSSEFKKSGKSCSCKYPGTFTCGECRHCSFMNTSQNIVLPNGDKYLPNIMLTVRPLLWSYSSVNVHFLTLERQSSTFGKEHTDIFYLLRRVT